MRETENKYYIQCLKCNYKWSFSDKDIELDSYYNNDFYYIICPQCKNEIRTWNKEDWLKK